MAKLPTHGQSSKLLNQGDVDPMSTDGSSSKLLNQGNVDSMPTEGTSSKPLADNRNVKKMDSTTEYNIPSNPEIKNSTIIRFGLGAIGGKAFTEYNKAKNLGGYDPIKEGKRNSKALKDNTPWGESKMQYAGDASIEESRWFAGVKVLDSLIMSFPTFTTDQGRTYPKQAIEIQNMMMYIQQKKNIQRTRIAGSDGRVKQYISLDDYDITVKGKLVGHDSFKLDDEYTVVGGGWTPNERPDAVIHAFCEFMEAPTAFNVSCDFLKFNGIRTCVVEGFKLTPEVGRLDNQAFQFKMLSDAKFEIIIEDF